MDKQTALHIVQTLAQGIDPHTGVVLPADSPCQHPDTVRALFQAMQALAEPQAVRARAAPQPAPANAGKPWTDAEDQALAERFDAGRSLPELAAEHGRSRAAIQARLVKLGKLEPPAAPPRFSRLAAAAAAADRMQPPRDGPSSAVPPSTEQAWKNSPAARAKSSS
jgi:hypothetical protein